MICIIVSVQNHKHKENSLSHLMLLQNPQALLVGSLSSAERLHSSLMGLGSPRPVLKLLAFCCSLLRVVGPELVLLIMKNTHI